MRNLNDIEAKTVLLLTEIELAMKDVNQNVPYNIIIAASKVREAMQAEDAQLGRDLEVMAAQVRKVANGTPN